MFDRRWLASLKKAYATKNNERQRIIAATSPLGHAAKKIIFALQRGEDKQLDIKGLTRAFKSLQKTFGVERLTREGSYRAALEEYAEAVLFDTVIRAKKIASLDILIDAETYLGALSDVSGELVRRVTNLISAQQQDEASRTIEAGRVIINELVEFDMTGNLRAKYDQARNNLKRLEQLYYELSKIKHAIT